MSVSNQTNKTYGSGDGVTATFSYPFKVFDVSELYAYKISAAGVVTGPLTYTTDFTATISSVSEGGTVTFIVAPVSGSTWFLKRIVPFTQSASIPSEGTFPGKQFENQLDLITMMVIQANETISRALTLPVTFTGSIPSLPTAQDGYCIGWDGTSGAMKNILPGATGPQGPTGPTGATGPAGANGIFSAIASQAEALAGTDNTKGMTPLRTAQSRIFKVLGGSRLMDANSGDVAYTGAGGTPKAIIAYALVDQTKKASLIGFFTPAGDGAALFADSAAAGQYQTGGGGIFIEESGGVNQSASLKTMDSDGFTLTWTKGGAPASATVTLIFLCFI